MSYRSVNSVRLHAIRCLNIHNHNAIYRKYHFDESVFSKLTSESCYWAGFIAADGCIVDAGGWKTLSIELSQVDVEHLRKFKEFVNFSGPIRLFKRREGWEHCGMRITKTDSRLFSDLKNNFSITPRKTRTLQPPKINDDYLKFCFVVGFLDGDGTVCLNQRRKTLSINIVCASHDFLSWLKSIVDPIVQPYKLRNVKRNVVRHGTDYWQYGISGVGACALCEKVRSSKLPVLPRKWYRKELGNFIKDTIPKIQIPV